MGKHGIFVGLVTLDFVYLTSSLPGINQKMVALDYTVTAGGPATNAAITFSYWGNTAKILGVVGEHPITHLIRSDLASYRVEIQDLDPKRLEPPPVSSILVTNSTGDRAVISLNATKSQIIAENLSLDIVQNVNIILFDGHQMAISQKIAELAQAKNIPIVIDGGSWKPGFAELLPLANYVICSANFYPPGCETTADVIAYLAALNIPYIAITHGEKPIQYLAKGIAGTIEVPVIKPVDTLGAGDIFHGAFCHYILHKEFPSALQDAAKVAAESCQYFGTRRWMS
ncbi:ribokinase [[Phormidium ambiguum] IAM M-71]|uniref:Ribokinase n=1 Tax=[Phormidium ambiguum] IAM M-71 TaxID=454136 RepID=A0A1U7IN99_9CYAN|nr:sugar kinase [Phormidium ambiguum]OKH38776.1 ribokinase [Phormidium ambiguum IAM M-71]